MSRDVTQVSRECHKMSQECHKMSQGCHQSVTRCHKSVTRGHTDPARPLAPPPTLSHGSSAGRPQRTAEMRAPGRAAPPRAPPAPLAGSTDGVPLATTEEWICMGQKAFPHSLGTSITSVETTRSQGQRVGCRGGGGDGTGDGASCKWWRGRYHHRHIGRCKVVHVFVIFPRVSIVETTRIESISILPTL